LLRRNIKLLDYQIAQAKSQIGRIPQAYENSSLLYTPEEAARRIAEYRDKILKATHRKEELESSLERIVRDSESMERIKVVLTRVHMENVRDATFEDRVRILNILDVKVYPSENLDAIGITCAVNLAGLESEGNAFSCYNTNIASPKL